MKKFLLLVPLAFTLAACETSTDRTVTAGALTGAAVGAIASDKGDRLEGAALGAVAGGATGALIDAASNPRNCIYRYPDGREYRAQCPKGY